MVLYTVLTYFSPSPLHLMDFNTTKHVLRNSLNKIMYILVNIQITTNTLSVYKINMDKGS